MKGNTTSHYHIRALRHIRRCVTVDDGNAEVVAGDRSGVFET